MDDIPDAGEVIARAGPEAAGITDLNLIATCEQCAAPRNLAICDKAMEGAAKVYRCPSCKERLVITRRPADTDVAGSGYKIGEFMIANAVEVVVKVQGRTPLTFPATRHATTFDARANKGGAVDGT